MLPGVNRYKERQLPCRRVAKSDRARPADESPDVASGTTHVFQVGDQRLSYEVHGEGPRVLVYLHGLLLDARMNRAIAKRLAADGNRVVLLDLPGHGRSGRPKHASAHRMDSYARFVVDLLDELDVEQAVVGGVSLGANVSLQVATRVPERVRGLVLEMPVLEWATPGAAMVFLPMLIGLHYAAPIARVVSRLTRLLPETGFGPIDSFIGIAQMDPEESAAVLHGMLLGPIAPTYEERFGIDVPTLVIGHRNDFIHPFSDASNLVRQVPASQLLEASSIVELRLRPERLTAEISSFLDHCWSARLRRHA
jgi:pimeloyl-ACP methyl ester carboxylesterase